MATLLLGLGPNSAQAATVEPSSTGTFTFEPLTALLEEVSTGMAGRFVAHIQRALQARGVDERDVMLVYPGIFSPPLTPATSAEALPLADWQQGKLYLALTPSRVMAELWLNQHPSESPAVLTAVYIEGELFQRLAVLPLAAALEKLPASHAFLGPLLAFHAQTSGPTSRDALAYHHLMACSQSLEVLLPSLLEHALKRVDVPGSAADLNRRWQPPAEHRAAIDDCFR
ncbi:MAG: hypothetical protein COA87_000210 [Halomonas sp.]|nr:hypothetical protein [Halomonas sp.]MBL1266192.1 hypothetical protein [Halomonas sp.]